MKNKLIKWIIVKKNSIKTIGYFKKEVTGQEIINYCYKNNIRISYNELPMSIQPIPNQYKINL